MNEEHAVTGVGWSGPEQGTLRITCLCGWTEKSQVWHINMKSHTHRRLMELWEIHAYPPETLALMHELSGCEICAERVIRHVEG